MINKLKITISIIAFLHLSLFSQTVNFLSESIVVENLKIIDKTIGNQTKFSITEYLDQIDGVWNTQSYLNEYDGVYETRLYRNESFLHKEGLAEGHLGNSSILDDSIILVGEQGIRFFVGMPISTLKKHFPKTYDRSSLLKRGGDESVKGISITQPVMIDGESVAADVPGLTFIYSTETKKVMRIHSAW